VSIVSTLIINSGISFLSHRTNAKEYLTISRLLLTALVALLNLTSLSLKDEWRGLVWVDR